MPGNGLDEQGNIYNPHGWFRSGSIRGGANGKMCKVGNVAARGFAIRSSLAGRASDGESCHSHCDPGSPQRGAPWERPGAFP